MTAGVEEPATLDLCVCVCVCVCACYQTLLLETKDLKLTWQA